MVRVKISKARRWVREMRVKVWLSVETFRETREITDDAECQQSFNNPKEWFLELSGLMTFHGMN